MFTEKKRKKKLVKTRTTCLENVQSVAQIFCFLLLYNASTNKKKKTVIGKNKVL